MSTKNLARTVIEGGRARSNRFQRRHSNSVERTHAHVLELQLCRASELDSVVFEPRDHVYRGFDDKLGPALRWLRSQVGRPWDKVRGELFARFDARTTAGRHVLFDHLLREVRTSSSGRLGAWARFEVSPHGILLYCGHQRPWWSRRQSPLPEPEGGLRVWLGGRRVQRHGERLYWLHPTEYGAYRQQHELGADDVERFERLPDWFREQFEGVPPPPPEWVRGRVR